jgi:hypothetical protein
MPDDNIQVTGQSITREVKTISAVEPPQAPEVYANNVVPVITSFDITLHFGSILEIVGDEAKVARRVSIVLTPEVAKMLTMQLSFGLAGYEKNVRPIPSLAKMIPKPQNLQVSPAPEHTEHGSE